jgi:lysophospholipase L1-like esterase
MPADFRHELLGSKGGDFNDAFRRPQCYGAARVMSPSVSAGRAVISGAPGRAGLLLGGVLVALWAGELIVRALGLAPDVVMVAHGRYRVSSDPEIGYEPIPGLKYEGRDLALYDYRSAETNSLGYRDREHGIERAAGARRVVVVGDSLAVGLWIDRIDDIFPMKLEAYLGQLGHRAEVMNFGVVGYNTLQEVATLRVKGLAYEPDVVVVEYCLNDRHRDDGNLLGTLLAVEKDTAGLNTVRVSRSLAWSSLYRFVRFRVLSRFGGTYRDTLERAADRLAGDSVEEALQKLGSLASRGPFKVVLAVFPDFTDLVHYRFTSEHARLRKASEREGFIHLDLLPAMRECASRDPARAVAIDRYHPSVYGHDCAARAMAAVIAGLPLS